MLLASIFFSMTPYMDLYGISQHTISYGDSKDLILVHTVQLKPILKANSSGRMVSSGISDVVITSVHSEETRLKKLVMIMMMIMIIITSNRKTIY